MDALRAVAMLLGIVLHASLSFVAAPWPAQDSQQQESLGVIYAAIHGFRMPLFFLVSGFFTAMLWRTRGLKALAKHRIKRILLPMLLGLVTIVPAVNWASGWAIRHSAEQVTTEEPAAPRESENLWDASARGDLANVKRFLGEGADIDALDPAFKVPALTWATLYNRARVVEYLIETGADVSVRSGDGGTALHAAAFLGYDQTADLLIDHGAPVDARNDRGETPYDSASVSWEITRFIAGFLKIEVDEEELMAGRAVILERLMEGRDTPPGSDGLIGRARELIGYLMYLPLFHHLWFLWYLCWLVAGFLLIAWVLDRLNLARPPGWLVFSPLLWLWLIPLTLLLQAQMGKTAPIFGPDTSTGALPLPHLLAYYAVFFGFGALYYHYDDQEGRLGRWWWLTLPVALFAMLPIGLMTTFGESATEDVAGTGIPTRAVTVLTHALYAWMMTIGMMGLFRRLFSRSSPVFRYISDSSYWLYLAHLPLVILLQAYVSSWPLPAALKYILICVVSTALLLLSYQWLIRYGWVGTMLNGPRSRGGGVEPEPVSDSPVELPRDSSGDP